MSPSASRCRSARRSTPRPRPGPPPPRPRCRAPAATAVVRPGAPPRRTAAASRRRRWPASVEGRVLEIIAEQTGYPQDMLDMDLDLEADLGIDTVKQAEVFAAIREAYGIERDDTLKLRDYPTVNHVVAFVRERAGEPAQPAGAEPAAPRRRLPSPGRRRRWSRAACSSHRRADRLSAGPARHGPRPRGRPGHRHRQAGGGVRRHPRGLRHRARRHAQAARLPDRQPRRRIRRERGGVPANRPAPSRQQPRRRLPRLRRRRPTTSRAACLRSSPSRPAIRRTCSYMDLDLGGRSGQSTPSSRLRSSPPSARPTAIERDDTLESCATTRRQPRREQFVRDRGGGPDPTRTVDLEAGRGIDAVGSRAWGGAGRRHRGPRADDHRRAATGYPQDLLDMDLDLEADLGAFDTVAQAEVFAASPRGPRRSSATTALQAARAHRRGVHHVAAPARERGENPPAAEPAAEPAAAAAPSAAAPGAAPLEAADAEGFPRRVPVPVLRPPLERCVATGVTLGEGSRVVVMPDAGGVGTALADRLGKLGVEVLTIEGAPDGEALEALIAEWAAAGPIHGVYWLPALDDERSPTTLDPAERREALRVRVKLLAIAMRALAEQVGTAGTFLVSATRLGGRHGYDADGATSVLGGAVTGFTKALSRERPDALVKAVDFAPSRKTAALADVLLRGDAARSGRRRGRLRRRPALVGRPGRAARRARRGARAHRRHGVPRDGRRGQHRVRDHRRPGCGVGRHLPPARPRTRARSRRSRPGPVHDRSRRPQARACRPHPRARRASDAQARRARAGADRAGPRGAGRDRGDPGRRRQRPLAPGRPDRRAAGVRRGGGGARGQRPHRRAAALRRAWRSATSSPTSPSASSTSCSTSRPTAG